MHYIRRSIVFSEVKLTIRKFVLVVHVDEKLTARKITPFKYGLARCAGEAALLSSRPGQVGNAREISSGGWGYDQLQPRRTRSNIPYNQWSTKFYGKYIGPFCYFINYFPRVAWQLEKYPWN